MQRNNIPNYTARDMATENSNKIPKENEWFPVRLVHRTSSSANIIRLVTVFIGVLIFGILACSIRSIQFKCLSLLISFCLFELGSVSQAFHPPNSVLGFWEPAAGLLGLLCSFSIPIQCGCLIQRLSPLSLPARYSVAFVPVLPSNPEYSPGARQTWRLFYQVSFVQSL